MNNALELLKILEAVFPNEKGRKTNHRLEVMNNKLVVTLFFNESYHSFTLEKKDMEGSVADVVNQIVDHMKTEDEENGLS
jgi:hypothetical protein